MSQPSRVIENSLAVLGGLLAAAYVLGVEVIPHVCYSLGRCNTAPSAEHAFPWGVVLAVVALVLPKTVGRGTSGRVWDALAGVVGRRAPGGGGGAAG